MNDRFTPDNLVAGSFPRLAKGVTVQTDTPLVRGSVLGKISANGKYTLAKAAATDGSQSPVVILAETIESGESVPALVYITGEFSKADVVLGDGLTIDAAEDALHIRSIFLVETM